MDVWRASASNVRGKKEMQFFGPFKASFQLTVINDNT